MLYGLISPARDARHRAENGFSARVNGRERGLLAVALEDLVAGGADLGTMLLETGQDGEIALVDHRTAELLHVAGAGLLFLRRAALGEGSGRIVLCASTCDPERIAALAQRVAMRGLRLLETPVSGASGQVSRGEGVGLIGGDPDIIAEVEPVLRAMFPTYFHIGKIGDGGRAKLAVNLILGLNRLAVAEGLVFAERLGLDPEAFLKVARSSAAYSQVMDVKGAKMIRGEFAAEGRITQHLKDVHLMLEQAERVRQQLPLLEIHADVLEACVRHGESELDNSAVIKEIRRRTRP